MTATARMELTEERRRTAWLEERRSIIGASEIATVIGLNEYESPIDLFLKKTGAVQDIDNPAMKAGRMLEPVILRWAGLEIGEHTLLHNEELYHHPSLSMIGCTPDAVLVDLNGVQIGLIEAKNTRQFIEEPVMAHVVQLQYQLGVTGLQFGYLAYLVQGCDFKLFRFDRNENQIDVLFKAAQAFWNDHVAVGVPPDAERIGDTAKMYRQHFAGKTIEASAQTEFIIDNLRKVKAQIKSLTAEEEEYKSMVQDVMQDAEAVVLDGRVLCTWKTNKSSMKFDEKRFRAEHPDTWAEYADEKLGNRVMLIK